jgi:hypothetical protein|tara:strand:- start:430 stop:636 length:207 start_codon:yes stop_codon:yes gene_type:complete
VQKVPPGAPKLPPMQSAGAPTLWLSQPGAPKLPPTQKLRQQQQQRLDTPPTKATLQPKPSLRLIPPSA